MLKKESLSSKIWTLVLTALLISNGVFCIASLIQSRNGVEQATRQRMLDIVNCAAGSVDGDILKKLTEKDIDTPEYRQVYDALAVYRDNVELKYVYAVRDEGNGVFSITVDPTADDPARFGQQVVRTEALYSASKGVAAVDITPYTDEWGRFYSSYSPVFDSEGNVAGIIACDFSVPWVEEQIGRQTINTTLIYILVLAVTLIGAGIICYFQIRVLTKPLKHMTEVAKRYENGDFSEELTVESVEEIDELSRSLQAMAVSLSEQITRAEIANHAKTRFLAHMSHEIRTPINAVLGMNEMILRESADEAILPYAENVETAGKTLLSLINDILDFSRIEAGKLEIRPVDYDLSYLVNDLANLTRIRSEKKGLMLVVDFDRNTPGILYGDEVRLRQILTNLLSNAVKYTEKGTITFSIGFSRLEEEPDQVLLKVKVRDTGIGIKPENIEKLFSEFERIDELKNRKIEGTGLGVSITRSLLEMMGSSLKVESVWGEGSCFSFDLKQKVVKWDPIGGYEVAYRTIRTGRRKYHVRFTAPKALILAVDDNPMNLMVFQSLLKQTKVVIETAEDGNEGMQKILAKKYDMIFLDHMMPGKSGIEILHETRYEEENPNHETPMVCLTANAISGMREEYISEGFDGYLAKPIDPSQLEDMLSSLLPEGKVIRTSMRETDENKEEEGEEREAYEELKALNDFEAIDPAAGFANSGSARAYRALLLLFYEEIDKNTRELTHFYENGELREYRICIHGLKSSARVIGATDLGEQAQLLENAAKEEDAAYIGEHQEAFLKDYAEFKQPLAGLFLTKTDSEDKPVAGEERMAKALEELRMAAEEMDCDWLDSILKELEAFRIPKEEENLFREIKAATARYDYETILSILPGGGQG